MRAHPIWYFLGALVAIVSGAFFAYNGYTILAAVNILAVPAFALLQLLAPPVNPGPRTWSKHD